MPESYPIAVGQPLSLGAAAPETARLNEAFHSTRASRPSPRSRSSAKRSSEPAALSLRPGQETLEGKQPHYFTRTDGQVISLAGLWDRQISELPYQWWWSSNLAPAHSNKLRRLFIPECPVLTLDVPTEKGNGPSAAQLSASRSAVGRSRS